MRSMIFGVSLLVCAASATAQTTATKPTGPAVAPPVVVVVEPSFDPARLAAARTAVDSILPKGAYGKMMQDMMGSTMDQMMGSMLDMSTADLAKSFCPETGPKKQGCEKGVSTESMREQIKKEDPYFEERMHITAKVMGEEFGRIGAILEPGMREGLSKSLAKRFTVEQLTDVNRFFGTSSGHAFAAQMLSMWIDPEVMKSVMGSMPELMKAMPDMMKKVEAATAHLPKPKAKAKAKPSPTS